MDRYIGLYWTLPVPWAGFTQLSKEPETAAQESRTIRYQREMVRRWVSEQGGTLVHEEVFLEIAPDRGSDQLVDTVERLLRRCRKEQAKLVMVEFWEAFGWRRHGPLLERLEANKDLYAPLYPDPVSLVEGAAQPGQSFHFEPSEHFRTWRAIEQAHAAAKPGRQAELAQVIAELQEQHTTLQDLADTLNEAGYRTATGKRWTGDNVRKFAKTL